jgi:hypothetical protein
MSRHPNRRRHDPAYPREHFQDDEDDENDDDDERHDEPAVVREPDE